MTTKHTEREKFEAWVAKDGGDLRTFGSDKNTHYQNSAVNNAWEGWQAALLAVPLTEEQMVKMAKDAGFNLEPTANFLYTVRGNLAQVINLIRLTEAAHGIGKDQA